MKHHKYISLALLLGSTLISTSLVASDPLEIVNRIPVANVWAGHPVGFELKNHNGKQYVGYYDADRHMTIAVRDLNSDTWQHKRLATQVTWDSHNYITFAFDRDGHMHVIGNLHVTPLIYYRTTVPGDISSLTRVGRLTGDREMEMTYPRFFNDTNGNLIFNYRDGRSGSGSEVFNIYDEDTRTWLRLLYSPLFDGQGQMNAYAWGPVLGPDNYWHVTWVWRDTPDAGTNHDLSYARSADLINWETVDGTPLQLPLRLDTPGLIVDPVPVNGGILNGSTRIGYDMQNRLVIAYHKYDANGATQVYLARAKNGAWEITQLTNWTHRWDLQGRGTIPMDLNISQVRKHDDIGLYITLDHKIHGKNNWLLDPETLQLVRPLTAAEMPAGLPGELYRPARAGMGVRNKAAAANGQTYFLRWETLPSNRDRPHEGEIPAPSPMELIILE